MIFFAVDMSSTIYDATDWSFESLHKRIGDRLQMAPPATLRVSYLDTFDWRIHRAKARLTIEKQGRRKTIRWQEGSKPSYALPISSDVGTAGDLPRGFLRDRLQPILEARALLFMGSCRIQRQALQILDERGDSLVRLTLETIVVNSLSGRATSEHHRKLLVSPLPGREQEAQSSIAALAKEGAVPDPGFDAMTAAASVLGRRPGDYRSKPRLKLKRKTNVDSALRSILLQLFKTLSDNVDGVIEDVDIEFLHDLRVASRRTRSALSQLKGVLPKSKSNRFAAEFEWLGSVTGPCRDLDVNLLDMDRFRLEIGSEDDTLEPLHRLLRRSRAAELRRVRRALRSARFNDLVSQWSEFLEEPGSDSSDPIGEIADKRILKAYRRMLKRGSKLGDDPQPEALHRLRIDAKKLRYLLEFFSSLYPRKTLAKLVIELKKLQDVLGNFNDMEVQQTRLAQFADQLISTGEARSDTVFAMGRLADAMRQRQEDHRRDFAECFAEFADEDSRQLYQQLFGET